MNRPGLPTAPLMQLTQCGANEPASQKTADSVERRASTGRDDNVDRTAGNSNERFHRRNLPLTEPESADQHDAGSAS